MATEVAETCRWSVYNKIILIHPSEFVGVKKYFVSKRKVWGPRFQENRNTKVVSFSAVRTGSL